MGIKDCKDVSTEDYGLTLFKRVRGLGLGEA